MRLFICAFTVFGLSLPLLADYVAPATQDDIRMFNSQVRKRVHHHRRHKKKIKQNDEQTDEMTRERRGERIRERSEERRNGDRFRRGRNRRGR